MSSFIPKVPFFIPKVPFQSVGDADASWYDLYNRAYRERCLFLFKEVEEENANQIIGLLIVLTIEDDTWDFHLLINSGPGRLVIPGVAIYDTMHLIKPNVHTVCMGEAAAMGAFVLVGGEMGTRLAYPHAKVSVQGPSRAFKKRKMQKVKLDSWHLVHLQRTIAQLYVQRTGQPRSVIDTDLERSFFMTAEESRAYGIVDLVGL